MLKSEATFNHRNFENLISVPSICLFLPRRRVITFDEQLNSNEFLHTFIPVHDLSDPCAQTVATVAVQQMPPQSGGKFHHWRCKSKKKVHLPSLFTQFTGSISDGEMLGFSCGPNDWL